MDQNKTSDQDRSVVTGTEVAGVGVGIATALATSWLALRKKFSDALEKTGAYGSARTERDDARKILRLDTRFNPKEHPELSSELYPKTNKEDFFKAHREIDQKYKACIAVVHEELGVDKITPASLKRRLGLVNKSGKLEMIEKAGTFGFMAATLVIGCGVLLEISRNQKLKHQLEEKELSKAATQH